MPYAIEGLIEVIRVLVNGNLAERNKGRQILTLLEGKLKACAPEDRKPLGDMAYRAERKSSIQAARLFKPYSSEWPDMKVGLFSSSSQQSRNCALVLSEAIVNDKSLVQAFLCACKGADREVRLMISYALMGVAEDTTIRDLLLDKLQNGTESEKACAALALAYVPHENIRPLLLRLLEDDVVEAGRGLVDKPDWQIVEKICVLLGKIDGDKPALMELSECLAEAILSLKDSPEKPSEDMPWYDWLRRKLCGSWRKHTLDYCLEVSFLFDRLGISSQAIRSCRDLWISGRQEDVRKILGSIATPEAYMALLTLAIDEPKDSPPELCALGDVALSAYPDFADRAFLELIERLKGRHPEKAAQEIRRIARKGYVLGPNMSYSRAASMAVELFTEYLESRPAHESKIYALSAAAPFVLIPEVSMLVSRAYMNGNNQEVAAAEIGLHASPQQCSEIHSTVDELFAEDELRGNALFYANLYQLQDPNFVCSLLDRFGRYGADDGKSIAMELLLQLENTVLVTAAFSTAATD